MQRAIKGLSLALALAAIIAALMPVTATAAEIDFAWVELLEFSTVDNSGTNLFKVTTTGTISIDTPQYMRCTKVDMLLTHPKGYAPSSVKLRYNGVLYTLTMQTIDETTVRVYGANIPDTLYANLVFQINKSSSAAVQYQVLSCRVSALNSQEFIADADVYCAGAYYGTATNITVEGGSDSVTQPEQVRISVYDWMKYDSLTIWGSSTDMPIQSIRATIGTLGLPITVSYMEQGAFEGFFTADSTTGDTDGDGWEWVLGETTPMPDGKWLYCVTVDLSAVDRTATSAPLYVYLTGWYDASLGYTFLCQYVNGSIVVADTTNASWWTRFTAFFTDLLGGDSSAGDEYAAEMESQSQQMQEAVDQMNEVTRPPVEDVQVSVDEYVSPDDMAAVGDMVGGVMENPLVLSMVMISLILSLAAYIVFGKR